MCVCARCALPLPERLPRLLFISWAVSLPPRRRKSLFLFSAVLDLTSLLNFTFGGSSLLARYPARRYGFELILTPPIPHCLGIPRAPQHTMAARAMCLTIQEAGRTASPVELASTSVRRQPENGANGAGGNASADSKPSAGGGSTGGGARGSSPCRGPGGGANGSSVASSSAADSGGAEAPATTSSRLGSSRTRTRTNVSAPTGTLAAERGTWKLQPWRLWPVHQPAAVALLEPCLGSVVAVPELALLRKALAALAERTDKALRMMDGGTSSSSASESCGVKRGRGGATAGSVGGDSGGGDGGGGARGRSRGSGGGGGGKVKASGAPAAVAGSSRGGVGAGGGVLLGAAHKRRRQDDS